MGIAHNDRSGVSGAEPYADRTGFFWFFKPDNIELVVKVLDGTPVNGKTWVFYGALTDVGYTLTVTDTATGHAVERYVNEPGTCAAGPTRGPSSASGSANGCPRRF